MSCQIFLAYFLLYFVCCQLCRHRSAAQDALIQQSADENTVVNFFKTEESIENLLNSKGTTEITKFTLKHIDSVSLVAADGVMIAMAKVENGETSQNDKFNLLAKFFEIKEEDDWGDKLVKNKEKNTWNVQLATKELEKTKGDSVTKRFAAVTKESKIYYIAVSKNTLQSIERSESSGSAKLHVRLVEGNVISDNTAGINKGKKTIKWEDPKVSEFSGEGGLKEKLNTQVKQSLSCDGFAFVSGKERNVYFVMKCNSANNNDKNITAVFQLEDNPGKTLKLLHVEDSTKCHFSLFLWKEEIVMTPTVCEPGDEGNQKMKVFDYEKKQFNESDRPIARLQEFLKDKKHFVTTKTDATTEVLLFTRQRKNTSSGKYEVYLWVTDGSRTAKVDTIITESKENFDLSILHTKNELFVLYNNYGAAGGSESPEDKSTYNLKRLPDQLDKIKKAFEAWNTNVNNLKNFCKNRSATVIPCSTDGLVSFLSDKGDSDKWEDEYEYVDANVNKGKKIDYGFQFDTPGAGALWLIGKKDEDQVYNFADFGFSLVATVTIDMPHKNEELRSLLGVQIGDSTKSVGVWCLKENMIIVKENKERVNTAPSKTYVVKKKYQVALVYKSNKISVYIDWESLVNEYDFEINKNTQKQLQFYFGSDGTESNFESYVTVTNVLLYNRPFNGTEIGNLKNYVKSAEATKNIKENTKAQQTENTETITDQQPPTQLPQDSTGEEKNDETPSPSRTEDGGAGGGVRVFSLLLAVLCVSAPLLHL